MVVVGNFVWIFIWLLVFFHYSKNVTDYSDSGGFGFFTFSARGDVKQPLCVRSWSDLSFKAFHLQRIGTGTRQSASGPSDAALRTCSVPFSSVPAAQCEMK